ncbi:hypothetical protein PHMEG_00024746, partial [Phytophthora megakarya]
VTIAPQPQSKASVNEHIVASSFGCASIAALHKVLFISSNAQRSASVSSMVIPVVTHGSGTFRRTSMRSVSCRTPSPEMSLPHQRTARWYKPIFFALSCSPSTARVLENPSKPHQLLIELLEESL